MAAHRVGVAYPAPPSLSLCLRSSNLVAGAGLVRALALRRRRGCCSGLGLRARAFKEEGCRSTEEVAPEGAATQGHRRKWTDELLQPTAPGSCKDMHDTQTTPIISESLQMNAIVNGTDSPQQASSMAEVNKFCMSLGGHTPIHSVLIANNGMAATKFMASIRSWAMETFGTEKAVNLVAMATPEDIRINAEHLRIADQFVEVPGGTNNNNYANVQKIVEIANRYRVSAVWPGWGHASENPELPDALAARGIIFLGPSAISMAALGDKIGSTLIAQAAGVPTLPWSGSHVKISPESCLESIPEEIYREACVSTTEEALSTCRKIGYPAMIKASWGGGGKGIRKVHNDDEVRAFFKQVQGEVPGSPIFIMKLASECRHLEVQLLCDQYGNVAALHGRDCSVQRRHQKIIEEGPITVASPETVKELEQAARRLAKCVNYVGAATVEFLYSVESGEYYFLELNPRLQVEHPVTERITQINLPAAQVAVGMGIPLWQLPEIRRFCGMDHGGGYDSWRNTSTLATPFDFDKVQPVRSKGHCVAVRITSEDPDDGFKPTSGKIQDINFKSKPDVWAYFSVKSGGGIHEFSDSQFGHVFAFGESRALAIKNMLLGLKELHIQGDIHTNVDYTIDLLKASEYSENKFHTGWLDSRIAMRIKTERAPWYLSVIGGALYKASTSCATTISDYVGYLAKGQIPPKNLSLVTTHVTLNIDGRKYVVDVKKSGPGSYKLIMNKSEIEAEVHTLPDDGFIMQLDGRSHVIYAEREASGTRLRIGERTCFLENDHDPSKLLAETPGKLVRFLVPDGSHVDAGTPYAEVEMMKMFMSLLLPASGVIHFMMSEGQAIKAGDLIARLDLDDLSAIRRAELFKGCFPALGQPTAIADKINQRYAASLHAAQMILAGYERDINKVVQDLLNCLDCPELPYLQWDELMSVLATRLPKNLKNELDTKFRDCNLNSRKKEFPAKFLRGVIEENLSYCAEKDRATIERLVEPLMTLLKSYEGGLLSHARLAVQSIFEDYLAVEELFSNNDQSNVIEGLRQQYKNDLSKVVDIVISHQNVARKNKLVLQLMEALVYPNPAAYRDQMIRFSSLNQTTHCKVALKATQLLQQTKLCELRTNIARSLSDLEMFDGISEDVSMPRKAVDEKINDLVSAPLAVEDALLSLFDHSNPTLRSRVVETYIRRLYQPCLVTGSIRVTSNPSGLIASWDFFEEHIKTKCGAENGSPSKLSARKYREKRLGFMVVVKSLQFFRAAIKTTLMEASQVRNEGQRNMLHVVLVGNENPMSMLQDSGDLAGETMDKVSKILESTLSYDLSKAGIATVNCVVHEGGVPIRRSFHWSDKKLCYREDPNLWHLEQPLASCLELDKLRGFQKVHYEQSGDRQWHLYSILDPKGRFQRMFLRTLVRQKGETNHFAQNMSFDSDAVDAQNSLSFTAKSILQSLLPMLDELELHGHTATVKPDHSHMYLCILREQQLTDLIPSSSRNISVNEGQDEASIQILLKDMASMIYEFAGAKMHQLSVSEWEVRLSLDCDGTARGVWRIVVSNVTGRTCTVHVYREIGDPKTHELVYRSTDSMTGPLNGTPVNAQYQPLSRIEEKRLTARRNNTTYCYDFPLAFEKALQHSWGEFSGGGSANGHVKAMELIFANGQYQYGTPLVPTERSPGFNDVGMVAWHMEMSTPEFPDGREIIVVANDVTFKSGSFGPREDAFFKSVCNLAIQKKIPLIYLAANAGARIGVAEEVKECFRVGWYENENPEQGFHYIYLTPEDYMRINSSVIAHELKLGTGETRWVLDAIVGKEDGLGVENLTGSGAIASEFSRAYQETFTLTLVTGRTVGIGAYLTRLGMRSIQRVDSPVILTGFNTLNKLLGREVYSSQMQLGGPKIMATNGVTHLTVSDDLEGISAVLKWLSYVPSFVGGPLPILPSADPPERSITYLPENSCDPRAAICGAQDSQGKWVSGMFDKGSFVETLGGWAKTVVTGRARLGGIPVGIIAVETQTVMQVIPADPGQLDSAERVVPQAGQVWFPDSAVKTAQALQDFNNEGLPLFILANWRGFSGGQKDLFEGILQAGSTIVENLRTYRHPTFVYIPKAAELRGGAWVVVDSKINPDHIEMYAETSAKGNVLEPEGLIEIKFKTRDLIECMGRLDKQLVGLKESLREAKDRRDAGNVELLQKSITSRERQLLPIYSQIATRFAELHDGSLRMAAKGVIRNVVDWTDSRLFFYRRLRRRISEVSLVKSVRDAAGEHMSHSSAVELIKKWFLSSVAAGDGSSGWDNDEAFFAWREHPENYEKHLEELRAERFSQIFSSLDSIEDIKVLPKGLSALLKKVDPSRRSQLVEKLREILD